MARSVQVLLPLLCVALAEAQFDFHLPFFHLSQRPPLVQSNSDVARNDQPINKNVDNSYEHESWQHHEIGPQRHPVPDRNTFNYDRHHRRRPYDRFDPFSHGIIDPYFGGPYSIGHYDPMTHPMPGNNNVFNVPNQGYNPHKTQPPNDGNSQERKPDEKPKQISRIEKKPALQDIDRKPHGADNQDIRNNPEEFPLTTNEVKKNEDPKDKGDTDNKQVGLNKKKDFLLVGPSNNGNNIYLLHENKPYLNTVPNGNQPSNNVLYVPYNPGQSSNPVYQVINGQPVILTSNNQVTPDKINVNGYNNAISNPGQPTMTVSSGNQNPGYVYVYSNGQLIQIPGVVVNSGQNNVPIQNGNPVQGTTYMIANTVPSNKQNVPAIQNPGTNVIYTTLPNQGSNGRMVLQMPNCIHALPNNNCGVSNNGIAGNVAGIPNGVSNGYVQPNQGQNIPSQGAEFGNQNGLYQPAVTMPVNSGSYGYSQPLVSNQGLQPNLALNTPSQGAVLSNQNVPYQPAVEIPVNGGSNGYNQPMVSNQGQGSNVPNQGAIINNQNIPLQPAVEMPVNDGSNGYNQPMIPNQGSNVPNQGSMVNNQNMPLQPSGLPINSGSNGYNQLQAPNHGDQGANGIVNVASHDIVKPSLPNDNSMSSLGAQPAIMISDLKDKKEDKTGDEKDKKKSKDKKEKKDEGKKKEKINKDTNKEKEPEPLTNETLHVSNLVTTPK